MNDTKTLSNNFYSIALYELTGVPYFHIYTDILIYRFLKLQQVSYNFPVGWNFYAQISSKPKLNHNSTEPNITLVVVLDMKINLHTTTTPPTETQC